MTDKRIAQNMARGHYSLSREFNFLKTLILHNYLMGNDVSFWETSFYSEIWKMPICPRKRHFPPRMWKLSFYSRMWKMSFYPRIWECHFVPESGKCHLSQVRHFHISTRSPGPQLVKSQNAVSK